MITYSWAVTSQYFEIIFPLQKTPSDKVVVCQKLKLYLSHLLKNPFFLLYYTFICQGSKKGLLCHTIIYAFSVQISGLRHSNRIHSLYKRYLPKCFISLSFRRLFEESSNLDMLNLSAKQDKKNNFKKRHSC